MDKERKPIVIIGYTLCALYGISSLIYLWDYSAATCQGHAMALAIFFAALFLSAVGLIRCQEWGRRGGVFLGAAFVAYSAYLLFQKCPLLESSYSLLMLVIMGYLEQPEVKIHFRLDWKTARKSILVIDDDEGLVRTIKGILLPKGYSVLVATTGEKGLQIATLQRPDLIILDVILPGVKGREVCTLLKQSGETKDIPVIFLTSKNSPDDISAEMAAGAAAHLTKPVNAKMLLGEIKRILNPS